MPHRSPALLAGLFLVLFLAPLPGVSAGTTEVPFEGRGPAQSVVVEHPDGGFQLILATPRAAPYVLRVGDTLPAEVTAGRALVNLSLDLLEAGGEPVEPRWAHLVVTVSLDELATQGLRAGQLDLHVHDGERYRAVGAERGLDEGTLLLRTDLEGLAPVVVVADDVPPAVGPTGGDYPFRIDAPMTLGVTAHDASGIDHVRLAVDGEVLARDPTPPFSFEMDSTGLEEGEHVALLVAVDGAGNEGFALWAFEVGEVNEEPLAVGPPPRPEASVTRPAPTDPLLYPALGLGLVLAVLFAVALTKAGRR